MPPKKKARHVAATAVQKAASETPSAANTPTATVIVTATATLPPPPSPVFSDGWTDEQETTLFKAISIYRLKPAGMHKHFRVFGIAELMKNHGVSCAHTGVSGIWAKLRTLYNLDGLDEREDAPDDDDDDDYDYDGDGDGDDGSGDHAGSGGGRGAADHWGARGEDARWRPFELPEDTYGELMRARRLDPRSKDSPPRQHAPADGDVADDTADGWAALPLFFTFTSFLP